MEPVPVIRRVDQIEADVECLMCGRLIGQLFGVNWRAPSERRASRTIANLTAYRENVPGAQTRQLTRFERFRCSLCGGPGLVGELVVRALSERLPEQLCPIHGERRTGPGRPPRGCRCAVGSAAA